LHAPMATAQQVTQTIDQMRQNATTASIFFNNWRIFLMSSLPVLGWVYGINDWYSSGFAIGELFEVWNVTSFFTVLFVNPFIYTEALCLSLFIGESLYVVFLAGQNLSEAKERIKKYSWMTILAASILTFLSAWAEYLNINGSFGGGLILLGIFCVTIYFVGKAIGGKEK